MSWFITLILLTLFMSMSKMPMKNYKKFKNWYVQFYNLNTINPFPCNASYELQLSYTIEPTSFLLYF